MILTSSVMLLGIAWTLASTAQAADVTGGRVPSPREGFAAPGFELNLLGGGSVELSALRGKVVVINLWASWCPPCRAEMPAIQRVYDAHKDRGLEIIAVNTTFQDNEAAAAAFVNEFGLTFPIALDRTGEVSNRYLLRALPTTFFVDAEGVIRKIVIGGPMSEALIRTAVEGLLEGNS